jgi:AraC family transcriptional regulator
MPGIEAGGARAMADLAESLADRAMTADAPGHTVAAWPAARPLVPQPAVIIRTGIADLDAARFAQPQRFEALLPDGLRFGAAVQDNFHLPRGRYEWSMPATRRHTLLFGLRLVGVRWDVALDGRSHALAPHADHLLLMPAGTHSRWIATSGAERLLHFQIAPDWLEELAEEAGCPAAAAHLPLLPDLAAPQLPWLLRRMEAALRRAGGVERLVAEQMAVLCAAELLRVPAVVARQPRRPHAIAPWRLRAVLALIEDRLAEDLPLAALAAAAGLSRFHFARAFRAQVGMSPHRFVLQRRCERAKRLIVTGRLPLEEVGRACGFAHQAHFTTAFRRTIGTTPGRWRQERAS